MATICGHSGHSVNSRSSLAWPPRRMVAASRAAMRYFMIGIKAGTEPMRNRFDLIKGKDRFMIRKLSSGKYRLYSRKKDPKTGKRRNLGTFDIAPGCRKARTRGAVFQAPLAGTTSVVDSKFATSLISGSKANFETKTTLGFNKLLVSFDPKIRPGRDIEIERISGSGHWPRCRLCRIRAG